MPSLSRSSFGIIRPYPMYTLRFILALFLVVAVLSPTATYGESAIEPTIRIGLLTALSGYAVQQGTECRQAFELAKGIYAPGDKLHGYRLEYSIGDAQRKAGPALSEFNKLATIQRVHLVVLDGSPVGMAVNPISLEREIPIIGVVGHHRFVSENDYAFRAWPAAQEEGRVMAQKLEQDGKKRIALLTTEDDWTLAIRNILLESFNQSDTAIVYDQQILGEEKDFSSYVARVRSKEPDAIFLNLVTGQPGVALKKMRELRVNTPVYGTYFTGRSDELKLAGQAAEGLLITEIDFPAEKLNSMAHEVGMREPIATAVSYNCYVAFAWTAEAIKRLSRGTKLTGPELRTALLEVHSLSVLGDTLQVKDREVSYPFVYKQVINGALVAQKSVSLR